jgi:hypothetical protein
MILANGVCRTEQTDGGYTVTDPGKRRALLVRPDKNEATLLQGLNTPSVNLYELLKNLPGDASARPLSGKKLDGKEVLGFAVPAPCKDGCLKGKEITLTVWADPRTRLPLRIETADKDEKGDPAEIVVDQIVFDGALDAKLFDLEPPAGYKLRTEGVAELPPAPADPQPGDLVVTPRKGVDPVEFGMSREQVEEALGKADGVQEVGKNGYVEMNYGSRGLFLGVSKTLGVVTISCSCQQVTLLRIRDFGGKTDKGIALGAGIADVIKAYGEPTKKETNEGSTYLDYDKLGAWFTFFGDRLVQIQINRPR